MTPYSGLSRVTRMTLTIALRHLSFSYDMRTSNDSVALNCRQFTKVYHLVNRVHLASAVTGHTKLGLTTDKDN